MVKIIYLLYCIVKVESRDCEILKAAFKKRVPVMTYEWGGGGGEGGKKS